MNVVRPPTATENLRITAQRDVLAPKALKQALPLTAHAAQAVSDGRRALEAILDGDDPRLFLVIGPCSIHDVDQARQYAQRLCGLADAVSDTMALVMRAYFEKPRTAVGWKGLINDPRMDGSLDIANGLHMARGLLLDIANLGLPAATETLDPIAPQYCQDLITWSAIGARTTESQTHREMASGLSSIVGLKNGTDGALATALNALEAVRQPHAFLGINGDGAVSMINTAGNPYAHIVLRGGDRPNYDSVSISQCRRALRQRGVAENIMVDCSHANSNKDHSLQALVADSIVRQIAAGERGIVGMMLESNLVEGKQSIPQNLSELQWGVSVTDACMGWETTERVVLDMHRRLTEIMPARREAGAQLRARG